LPLKGPSSPQAANEAMTGSSNALNIETLFTGTSRRAGRPQGGSRAAVLRQYARREANNKASP
jgi:hypothetical protein